jgi:hypothetical protein
LNFLVFSSGSFNSPSDAVDQLIQTIRGAYQDRFEQMAIEGNYTAAFIDYIGLELVIPENASPLELGMAVIPHGKLAKLAKLGKPAEQLIHATLKRSPSYKSELARETYGKIIEISKGKGPLAHAAKGMKKLIENSERLMEKSRGKP